MSDDYIIRNCAPTLAGLKTANLFTCPVTSKAHTVNALRHLNRRLVKKGLRALPLRLSEKSALIYLYRPAKLRQDFSHTHAADLLRSQGYDPESCEKCLVHLIRKLKLQKDFPHEIGLFLGYPPEDVQGFMENRACGCKCTGCWKVYGDEEAARKTFARYKKCTRVYCEQWKRGRDIERLTVAG